MPLQVRDSQYFQNFPDNALESRFSTKKEHFANIPSSHFYKVIRFSSLKCLREEGLKMKHFFPNFLWLLSMPLQTSLIAKEKKLQQQWAPKAISELLLPFAASLVAFPTELPPSNSLTSVLYKFSRPTRFRFRQNNFTIFSFLLQCFDCIFLILQAGFGQVLGCLPEVAFR